MSQNSSLNEAKGFYRLSWLQRIGFGAGDLAQNLIYQTVSMYLLFFYTDIYGLSPADAALMFLIVRIVDVVWDPLVGAYVDKHNPKLGKYRAYLVLGGIPLTGLAIMCFWNGFAPSVIYAYVTYVGMSMLYTLINVPYGALNSSLTRDTNEITILTSTRMFMANIGGLAVSAGIPILVAILATGGVNHDTIETALFMGLGSLPAFIFMPLVPAIKRKVGKKNMFYIFLSVAIVGMAMLYIISRMGTVKDNIILVYIAQFIKSTGVIVATGYMWALIPEVISYGEYTSGRRISGIVNALTGIFFKAGMALGGVIPGLVLAWTLYQNPSQIINETADNIEKAASTTEMATLTNTIKEAAESLENVATRFKGDETADKLNAFVSELKVFDFNAEERSIALGEISKELKALTKDNALPTSPDAWFKAMMIFALAGLALLLFCFSQTKERVVMDEKDTKEVKVSDLWTEFLRNRPLRIVALFFITAFAMMSVGNAAGAYFMNGLEQQEPLAQEGIRWLVCVIPAILLVIAMWIISKYELEDDVVDKINREIEERAKN